MQMIKVVVNLKEGRPIDQVKFDLVANQSIRDLVVVPGFVTVPRDALYPVNYCEPSTMTHVMLPMSVVESVEYEVVNVSAEDADDESE